MSTTNKPYEYDVVENPYHYTSSGIECIDAMIAAFGEEAVKNFCMCNAFKYVWRSKKKNGREDMKKAIWYINKYNELNLEKEIDTVRGGSNGQI